MPSFLLPQALDLLDGHERAVTEENALTFELTDEKLVYPAPKGNKGLRRNCIVVYQVGRTLSQSCFLEPPLKKNGFFFFQAILAREARGKGDLFEQKAVTTTVVGRVIK